MNIEEKALDFFREDKSREIISWMSDNFIEIDESLVLIMRNTVIIHNCTLIDLYTSLQTIKKVRKEKTSVKFYLQYLTKMCDLGVKGADAGIELLDALNK